MAKPKDDTPYIPKMETMESLREELSNYKKDAAFSLFFSFNRKANEIAASLNKFEIDLTRDDKSFTNFMAIQKGLKDIFDTLTWLRNDYLKLTDEDIREEKQKMLPPLEQRALGK